MDWCLDTRVGGAADLVESEIATHLSRHAIEPGVVELARPIVRKSLTEPVEGPWLVTLDWSRHHCSLRLRPLPDGPLPGVPLGPGVTRAHDHAPRLDPLPESEAATWAPIELGVARAPQRSIDLPAAPAETLDGGGPTQLLGLISGEIASGRSLEEAATRAGATMAELIAVSTGDRPLDAASAAAVVIETERRMGADFEVVEADATHAVIRNRRCPFGPATGPPMCRFTSSLVGGLAARGSGSAQVSVAESLAAGDHQCRLVVDTADGLDAIVAHRYAWPVAPPAEDDHDVESGGKSFQVTLSLQLPRDRLSVPITRHLVRAAMDEVGVVSEDADAVDLAVTEACANVIDHSGPGDAYEVAVTISPSASHIRVVDIGRGFDHQALAFSGMAAHDAEHGRGVALMHALVDQVRFESEPEKGTVVHLVKKLNFTESAAAHRLLAAGGTEDRPPTP